MGKYEENEMRKILERSGWYKSATGWEWSEHGDRQGDAARENARQSGYEKGLVAGRIETAELVMKAFDLTPSYPDTTEERTGTRVSTGWYGGYHGRAPRTVLEEYKFTETVRGAAHLIEDLKAVAESRDVAEAKKRLGRK